jgi:cardiolipin synthase (CMP-forming)
MRFTEQLLKPPNLISLLRILAAPLLFLLAFLQLEFWFLGVLLFSAFTDVLDGFVARRLNMITPLGAHLDSWGDFVIYGTMAICAWILWPGITLEQLPYYALILFSILVPVQVGLAKFGKFTGYHTWGVKIAVFMTFVGYVSLYSGIAAWPFQLASGLCVIAGLEEIAITLVLRRERTDVRSLRAAIRMMREQD